MIENLCIFVLSIYLIIQFGVLFGLLVYKKKVFVDLVEYPFISLLIAARNEEDKIEDCLIAVIQTIVKTEDAFFVNALETGSLPQEWIDQVFTLLNPSNSIEKDEPIDNKTLTRAIADKPINNHKKFYALLICLYYMY
jgi:hypothetical protein